MSLFIRLCYVHFSVQKRLIILGCSNYPDYKKGNYVSVWLHKIWLKKLGYMAAVLKYQLFFANIKVICMADVLVRKAILSHAGFAHRLEGYPLINVQFGSDSYRVCSSIYALRFLRCVQNISSGRSFRYVQCLEIDDVCFGLRSEKSYSIVLIFNNVVATNKIE